MTVSRNRAVALIGALFTALLAGVLLAGPASAAQSVSQYYGSDHGTLTKSSPSAAVTIYACNNSNDSLAAYVQVNPDDGTGRLINYYDYSYSSTGCQSFPPVSYKIRKWRVCDANGCNANWVLPPNGRP